MKVVTSKKKCGNQRLGPCKEWDKQEFIKDGDKYKIILTLDG